MKFRYQANGNLLDLSKGKEIIIDNFVLRDHARGKNNIVAITLPNGDKITVGRKHVDESERTFGAGAVNITGGGLQVHKKGRTTKKHKPKETVVRIQNGTGEHMAILVSKSEMERHRNALLNAAEFFDSHLKGK